MNLHESITIERIEEAIHDAEYDLNHTGFCLHCGNEQEDIEPDAVWYTCYECGAPGVMGAEYIMTHMW